MRIKETIYSTRNFVLIVPNAPHIDREDGGHLEIKPKKIVINVINALRITIATSYGAKSIPM